MKKLVLLFTSTETAPELGDLAKSHVGAYTKKDGTLPGWKKTGRNNMTGEGH